MHTSLLPLLVDPVSRQPLTLDSSSGDERIDAGSLRAVDGREYPIVRGIPRFVVTEDAGQQQTAASFGYKWQQQDSYGSAGMRSSLAPWIVARYGFASLPAMTDFFSTRRRVLDAGCGGGFFASLWMDDRWHKASTQWVGLDISAAIDVARDRLGAGPRTHFVQADLSSPPFAAGSFDAIIAEGVLHHTPSTARALAALIPLLEPGGEILFYVYRRKAPLREFCDDYIRQQIAGMDPADAWVAMRPLTALGRALAELHAEVDVPEDVPLLGIKAGRYDVQRLIYWHVAKLYWNDALAFEENTHVNFDWYHPTYAHRHTAEEIHEWCERGGLAVTHFDETQESGYTIRAVRA
jgi:SAM-dependent methyltransferase